ncbi:MAG: hypothetical protein JXA57_02955 [Armatimonadetes bacterium]|nr:hypothetical protein [Armatimonadota bacterium]
MTGTPPGVDGRLGQVVRSARWLPRKQDPDGTYAKEPEAEVRWEVEE